MPIFGKDKSKKPEAALKDFSLVSTSNAENSNAPEVSLIKNLLGLIFYALKLTGEKDGTFWKWKQIASKKVEKNCRQSCGFGRKI